MFTVLAGLASSFSYATSDLLSQGVTRRTRALTQVVWVLATGVVIIVPVALLVDGLPRTAAQWHGAALSALAGVFYVIAFYCLLRGLHVGDLGLVSALNSLQGAYVSVAVILLGAAVTPALGAALALCMAGAMLTSVEGRAETTRGAPWALASGFLFACVMLCYAYAGGVSWLSQSAISRSVSFLIALPIALLSGGFSVPGGLRARAVGAGVLELGGLVLVTIAFSLGPSTVAGVTTTQFGTFAVLLGYFLLHERPKPHQWAGVVCTVIGVSLLAAIA